jgi:hypothetical protein
VLSSYESVPFSGNVCESGHVTWQAPTRGRNVADAKPPADESALVRLKADYESERVTDVTERSRGGPVFVTFATMRGLT